MTALLRTTQFDAWLSGLRDRQGKARILARLDAAALGNLGDCAPVGKGVSEMRIHTGPGYRIYFVLRNGRLLLLRGGGKSTQRRDIRSAIAMAKVWEGQ